MKSFFLAMALTCAAAPALATTYALENVVLPTNGLATSFPSTTIMIDPAAVQRGHFRIDARTNPVMMTGDIADFVSFQSAGIVIGRTGVAPYFSLLIDLSFNTDGTISTARLNYAGISPTIDLKGTGASLTGLYSPTDNFVCGGSADCRVLSAQLVEINEPAAVTILPLALASVLLWRRRHGIAQGQSAQRQPALLMTV